MNVLLLTGPKPNSGLLAQHKTRHLYINYGKNWLTSTWLLHYVADFSDSRMTRRDLRSSLPSPHKEHGNHISLERVTLTCERLYKFEQVTSGMVFQGWVRGKVWQPGRRRKKTKKQRGIKCGGWLATTPQFKRCRRLLHLAHTGISHKNTHIKTREQNGLPESLPHRSEFD